MARIAPFLIALSFLAFISLGLPDTVLGVAWPSLRDHFGLSQASLGLVPLFGVSGYFVSGLLAGGLVRRLGVGALLAASSGLVALGLVGYAAASRWAFFFPVAAVIGLGSGAIDAALNGYAARHFPIRIMNWLHASWSVGATAGPAIMTAVLTLGASYRLGYAILAAALGAMTLAFTVTRRSWDDPLPREPDGRPDAVQPEAAPAHASGGSVWTALRSGRVWLQIVIFFAYTGAEAGTGAWCFTVLREARGLSVEEAGVWTTVFWASLTAGRVWLGFVVDRVGPDRLLRAATVAALAGAAGFAGLPGLPGRLGLALLGFSLAPVFPTLMARTPARLGDDIAHHAIGFQVSAATLGTAVLPGGFGLLAARAGAGVVPLLLVLSMVVLLGLHEVLLRATRDAAHHDPARVGPRRPPA
jgi:fucose permease